VERRVANQGEHQRQGDHGRTLEQIVGESISPDRNARGECNGDGRCYGYHLAHDRANTIAECASVGNRAADFLLEWQEEPGDQGKHDEPQRHDGLETVLAEGFLPEPKKDVDRHPADQQARTNGEAALGQRNTAFRR
jgi:hypothetical protein